MKPTDYEHFDPSTEWQSFGDANSEDYGGTFLRYHDERWTVIETIPFADVNPDVSSDSTEQYVKVYTVRHDDVWKDGDLEEGVSEAMKLELRALFENGGKTGVSPEGNSARFLLRADYFVAGAIQYLPHDSDSVKDPEDYGGYAEMLESFDVDIDGLDF